MHYLCFGAHACLDCRNTHGGLFAFVSWRVCYNLYQVYAHSPECQRALSAIAFHLRFSTDAPHDRRCLPAAFIACLVSSSKLYKVVHRSLNWKANCIIADKVLISRQLAW